MHLKNKLCARKAAWLAFGLIALSAISSARDSPTSETTYVSAESTTTSLLPSPSSTAFVTQSEPSSQSVQHDWYQQDLDQRAVEATRAYKQAVATLTNLKSNNVHHPPPSTFGTGYSSSKSFISSFLPNFQGQGPFGSLLRILLRLYQMSFGRLLNVFTQDTLFLLSKEKERQEEQRVKAIKVVDLLQHSAELGNTDALFVLAQISLFPPTPHVPFNPRLAYHALHQHATRTGNATSQSLLAFYYASGYKNIVSVDQAKSQLYTAFAAGGGDQGAQMQLGYRYWSGIGTLENCHSALDWYGRAAEQAMVKFRSGPPGGRTLPHTPIRVSDLAGGIYGTGASVASTGHNTQRPAIREGLARAAGETWEDVLEYYLFNAERGEIDFAYRLGKIFYQGSIYTSPGGVASGSEGVGAVPRNYKSARKYFLFITRKVWPNDPPSSLTTKDEHKPVGYAAASAAFLGRMYLRGEGVKTDYTMAKAWFERSVENGDREGYNGLGIIYRDGLGVKQDIKKALACFDAAAAQELAEAQVNMGRYHFDRSEPALATGYFETAVRSGSPFEAYYYLGELHSTSASNPNTPAHLKSSSCAMAVSFYKIVAERGVWDDNLLGDAEAAWMAGGDQNKEAAILKWWIAAERGSETAQNNLAYILDQDKSMLRFTRFSPFQPSNETAHLALTQWIRAADQHNIDALVKVGDYYYHGLGVPEEDEQSRYEKAARYYRSASDTQMSALAMWNLGWMYENGIGVPRDFHLAKRYYDLALETNSEAYLPVTLSLFKLYAKSMWHTLRGGEDGLTIWGPEPEELANEDEVSQIEDGRQGEIEDPPGEVDRHREDEGGPWYFGKAKEEFHRRRGQGRTSQIEEDPIKWARDRRDADRERESDFGPEDYFDGALRARDRENRVTDGFGETVLLVLLCLVISILLYIRTRMVERMRREQREQGQNAANGGIFPPADDQGRGDWAILR